MFIYDDITYSYVCTLNYLLFICFYDLFVGLHILEEAKGLDLMGTSSNVGSLGMSPNPTLII